MTLTDCLRDRLLADGRTLGQLALRTGINKYTLSRWFNGHRRPNADSIDRAFAFLVSEGWDPLDFPCLSDNETDVAA